MLLKNYRIVCLLPKQNMATNCCLIEEVLLFPTVNKVKGAVESDFSVSICSRLLLAQRIIGHVVRVELRAEIKNACECSQMFRSPQVH